MRWSLTDVKKHQHLTPLCNLIYIFIYNLIHNLIYIYIYIYIYIIYIYIRAPLV